MTAAERDRIVLAGRERGAELASSVAGKANTLRALGWPTAVNQVRERKRAS
jgi:hypothetical protein